MSTVDPSEVSAVGVNDEGRARESPVVGDSDTGRRGWGTRGARLTVRAFLEHRLGVIGAAIVLFYLVFCFMGPLFYHSNQIQGDLLATDLSPRAGSPLGTDASGYDEFGRLMVGGQAALEIGLLAAAIATVIGVLYGSIAGLAGGATDGIMMRFVDMLLSIPFLFFILLLATKYRADVLSLGIIIGCFSWLVPSRLVRGEVLTLRTREFVLACRVMGGRRWRIIFRHLIPNALGVVVVNITFQVADAIIAVAFLGFLGFGLTFPHVSWGDMLANSATSLSAGYWWLIYPVGASLTLVVMAFNFIGDALRDAVAVGSRRA